jgi:hypothetical protein
VGRRGHVAAGSSGADCAAGVNAGQIFIEPITMPDYPDPTEIPRYIRDDDGFYGFDTVFLEDATWNALSKIARERGCTVDELCSDIGHVAHHLGQVAAGLIDLVQRERVFILNTHVMLGGRCSVVKSVFARIAAIKLPTTPAASTIASVPALP